MLDFTKIRGESDEGRRAFFEELVCRLAQLDGSKGEFRRIEGAGGDGGVEAIRLLPNGKEIGYQAKYHIDEIDWSKIDNSVRTALTQHPKLERYVIAVPRNLTGRRGTRGKARSTNGEWGEWDKRVSTWKRLAMVKGMRVAFEPWAAFDIEQALQMPAAEHLIHCFFTDSPVFTRPWMAQQLKRAVDDLQARYSASDHVDTQSLRVFDVIYRRANIRQHLRAIFDVARAANPRAAAALVPTSPVPIADLLGAENCLTEFIALGDAVDAPLPEPWPICSWFTSWNTAVRRLSDITNLIAQGIPRNDNKLNNQMMATTKVHALRAPEVFGGRWWRLLPVDGARAVLLIGLRGAGKSHALARGAAIAWQERCAGRPLARPAHPRR